MLLSVDKIVRPTLSLPINATLKKARQNNLKTVNDGREKLRYNLRSLFDAIRANFGFVQPSMRCSNGNRYVNQLPSDLFTHFTHLQASSTIMQLASELACKGIVNIREHSRSTKKLFSTIFHSSKIFFFDCHEFLSLASQGNVLFNFNLPLTILAPWSELNLSWNCTWNSMSAQEKRSVPYSCCNMSSIQMCNNVDSLIGVSGNTTHTINTSGCGYAVTHFIQFTILPCVTAISITCFIVQVRAGKRRL